MKAGVTENPWLSERLKKIRRTKLYDLCAAAPLIVWYGFWAADMLPSVTEKITLIKLFVQTDPSVLPVFLVLRTLAQLSALVFLALLVVMFVVRHVPQQTAPGFYSRFVAVAGTFLGTGIMLLPQQERSSVLYLVSLLLIFAGTIIAISAVFALGFDQHSAGSTATRNVGTLCHCPTSTLSRRDCCHFWNCLTVPASMGVIAGGTGMRIPTSAYKKRRENPI